MYAEVPCRGSFKAGFKAGYRFAKGGYDSCEPPVPHHFWRINGISYDERSHAQAWSDGFTHGSLAAQQDGTVGQSALELAAAQPPEGVPDVNYIVPPPSPYGMESPNGMPIAPMQGVPEHYQSMLTPNGAPQLQGGLPILDPPGLNAVPPPPAPPAGAMPQTSSGAQWAPSVMPPETLGTQMAQPQPATTANNTSQTLAQPSSPSTSMNATANSSLAQGAPIAGEPSLAIRPATNAKTTADVRSLGAKNGLAPACQNPKQATHSESTATDIASPNRESPDARADDWQLPVIRD